MSKEKWELKLPNGEILTEEDFIWVSTGNLLENPSELKTAISKLLVNGNFNVVDREV